MRRALLAAAVTIGAAVRLVALPLPGTTDLRVFVVWAKVAAAEGVGGIYGTRRTVGLRRLLDSGGVRTKVDYPPLAIAELALAGRAGVNGARAIKILTLGAEALLAGLLCAAVRRWSAAGTAAWPAALTLWLNPAGVMIGAVLGYLDPLFLVPALAALVAGGAWPRLAGVLIAAACLTKPLALFFVPAVFLAVRNGGDARDARRRIQAACVAAAAAALIIVWPVVWSGGLLNLAVAMGSLLRDPFLSGRSASIWTMVGAWRPDLPVDVARAAGAALAGTTISWASWRVRDARDPYLFAALGGISIHAYATLAVAVHENHAFGAVPLLALAAVGRRRLQPVFAAVSVTVALNLWGAYGLGVGVPLSPPAEIAGLETLVWLAALNSAIFAWHVWAFRAETARWHAGYTPPNYQEDGPTRTKGLLDPPVGL